METYISILAGENSSAADASRMLWLLSLLMFVSTLAIGFLPQLCKCNQKCLDSMAVYGGGLLIGAALIVIIPEGVMVIVASQLKQKPSNEKGGKVDAEALSNASGLDHEAVAAYIGVSMAAGFALMVVIDQLMAATKEWRSDGQRQQVGQAVGEEDVQDKYFSVNEDHYTSRLVYAGDAAEPGSEEKSPLVTTVGLVIHSISDGVALGASVYFSSLVGKVSGDKGKSGGQGGLGLVIFFAVLMHKIPATLGLGTFLGHCALPLRHIFLHLLAFTATSPTMAIVAFHVLQSSSLADSSRQALGEYVGILLLLSAGTFLYVSTLHILPEVYNKPPDKNEAARSTGKERACRRLSELVVILLGMFSPLALKSLAE